MSIGKRIHDLLICEETGMDKRNSKVSKQFMCIDTFLIANRAIFIEELCSIF